MHFTCFLPELRVYLCVYAVQCVYCVCHDCVLIIKANSGRKKTQWEKQGGDTSGFFLPTITMSFRLSFKEKTITIMHIDSCNQFDTLTD